MEIENAYPVSQKTLDFFKSIRKVHDDFTHNGIKFYHILQIDKDSGLTVEFYVYVTPKFPETKFTTIMKTPIENG